MQTNALILIAEIAKNEGASVEEITKKFHFAHLAGWECFLQTSAHYLAKLYLHREPFKGEVNATVCTGTCKDVAELIEDGIVSGQIPNF